MGEDGGRELEPMPIVDIVGERVTLGLLHRGLLPLLTQWETDCPTIDLGGADPRPRAAEEVAALWTASSKSSCRHPGGRCLTTSL